MAYLVYYCPVCKNMVATSLTGKCKVCGNQANLKAYMTSQEWQSKSKEQQEAFLADPGSLIPKSKEDKANFAAKVVKAKPLGIAISEEGVGGMLTNYVVYAFILEFEDGHRELYHGKDDDFLINTILSKVEM